MKPDGPMCTRRQQCSVCVCVCVCVCVSVCQCVCVSVCLCVWVYRRLCRRMYLYVFQGLSHHTLTQILHLIFKGEDFYEMSPYEPIHFSEEFRHASIISGKCYVPLLPMKVQWCFTHLYMCKCLWLYHLVCVIHTVHNDRHIIVSVTTEQTHANTFFHRSCCMDLLICIIYLFLLLKG